MARRKIPALTPDAKIEVLQAGLRGDRTVADVCREYEVSESDFYRWRDQLLSGARFALVEEPGRAAVRTTRTTTPRPPPQEWRGPG